MADLAILEKRRQLVELSADLQRATLTRRLASIEQRPSHAMLGMLAARQRPARRAQAGTRRRPDGLPRLAPAAQRARLIFRRSASRFAVPQLISSTVRRFAMQLAKIGAAALCALGLAACGSSPSYNDSSYYGSNSYGGNGAYTEYGRVVGIEAIGGNGDGRTSGRRRRDRRRGRRRPGPPDRQRPRQHGSHDRRRGSRRGGRQRDRAAPRNVPGMSPIASTCASTTARCAARRRNTSATFASATACASRTDASRGTNWSGILNPYRSRQRDRYFRRSTGFRCWSR